MSGAMLDCAICATRKWKDLEAAHEEDLRMAGAARLFCEGCTRETYWFYAQHAEGSSSAGRTAQPPSRSRTSNGAEEVSATALSGGASPEPPMRVMQTERRVAGDRRNRARRAQRRVALQVPVKVRVNSPASQFEEVTRTVNVCRDGIYIQSERPYSKGAPIYVAMNYSQREPAMASEQKATVVRIDSSAGKPTRGVAIRLN